MTGAERPRDSAEALRVLADVDAATGFSAERILEDAARATGLLPALTRYEQDALEAACRDFAREAPGLTVFGRARAAHVLRESAAKLLRARRYAERFPEIEEAGVRRPVLIAAPFRTGTTFLQRLLAQDPDLRWVRTWEAAQAPPAEPELRRDPRYFELDGRIAFIEQALERLQRMNPRLRESHETGARLPEECFGLLETTFTSHSFMFYARVSGYLDWLDRLDDASWRASYRLYALQLALLQWWSPSKRWVLKSPIHLWNLEAFLDVFPDAFIVVLHRDPQRSVPSFCRLLAAHYALAYRRLEDRCVGELVREYTRKVLARATRARRRLPPDRFIDLEYEDLLNDPLGCVRRIYLRVGAELPEAVETRMRAWLAPQPRSAAQAPNGMAQYGLDPAMLEHDFAAWSAALR
jgi:hypothetical protein